MHDESSAEVVDFSSMTKAELQSYADSHGIEEVNSSKQTKAEMIAILENL